MELSDSATGGAGGATGGAGGSGGTAGGGGSGALTYDFFIKTPVSVLPLEVIIGADGLAKVNDRVRLLKEVGAGRSSVSNVSGTQRAWFGPDAEVQNVWSTSGVELKNRAHVFGFIKSERPLVREPDSVVDGSISTTAELDPSNVTSWTVTFPTSSQGDIELLGGQTATPNSGTRFGAFFVRPNERLRLNPGIYYFDSLTIESGALLDLLNSTGAIQVYVRGAFRFRGTLTEAAAKSNTLFGIAGRVSAPADAFLEAPFRGIVVSPFGQTTLSTTTVGHIGSFFGQHIEIHQATAVKHRPFDRAAFCSGSQECGGLCPCVPEREPCTSPSQCAPGTTCPDQQNGWRFGLPWAARVCEPLGCSEFARSLGCGEVDSPCGVSCTSDVPCTGPGTCPGSQLCGEDNGRLRGSSFDDVCWDPLCETDARLNNCGDFAATCGVCSCTPNCQGKLCGQTQADGCGGDCTGFCVEREPGCTSDLDCEPGSVCFVGEGERIGLPDQNVCLPASCRTRSPAAEDCGGIDARCGVCPACIPSCSGRECGVDPVCGTSCGGECAAGMTCTPSGQCTFVAEGPPVEVPDGSGGTRVVPPLQPQPTVGAGALPGHFAVSESGAATYTIPIIVPPGRGGLEPDLRLVYDGSRVNGDLGMGWRIDGLSVISRCARSVALDGYVQRINQGDTDEVNGLCLDGKRLVPLPGYVQGQNGAEYRTLIDSFAKIVFHSADSRLQTSFTVWTKDGRVLTYGARPDAILATSEGFGPAYTWGLSRVADRVGNRMDIFYYRDAQQTSEPQDLQPVNIIYTGHGENFGNRYVLFEYEDERPDDLYGFRAGGGSYAKTRRLKAIHTQKVSQRSRSYRFAYDPRANGTSMISSATECVNTASGEVCKSPTTFQYDSGIGFKKGPSTRIPHGAWIDLNGDGRQDILRTRLIVNDVYKPAREMAGGIIDAAAFAHPVAAGVAFTYRMFLEKAFWPSPDLTIKRNANLAMENARDPYGIPETTKSVTGLLCSGVAPGFIFDYNADQRDDLLESCPKVVLDIGFPEFRHHINTDFSVALSNGDGSFQQAGTIFALRNATNPFTHDLNGDGLEDALYCYENALAYRLRLRGGHFGPEQLTESYGTLCGENPFRLQLDVDGNGVVELVVNRGHEHAAPNRELAALYYGQEGPYWQTIGRTVAPPLVSVLRVGDFNGDGLPDLYERPYAWVPATPVELQRAPVIWLNTGNGLENSFEPRQPTHFGPYDVRRSLLVTDYNGDGRSDVLYGGADGTPYVRTFSPALDSSERRSSRSRSCGQIFRRIPTRMGLSTSGFRSSFEWETLTSRSSGSACRTSTRSRRRLRTGSTCTTD